MNILKRKEALANIESRCGAMTSETKNFIQKICYKKSASIDMTRYGFIQDSKVRPINLMMKPLKEQLERIWGWFQNLFYRYVRLTLYLPRWRSDLRIAPEVRLRSASFVLFNNITFIQKLSNFINLIQSTTFQANQPEFRTSENQLHPDAMKEVTNANLLLL